MKKILFTLLLSLCCAATVHAQSATSILDKAAATFRKAGGVKIGYTYQMNGQGGAGDIQLKGNKFVNHMDGQKLWFNGKTLWTYIPDNQEVNVTTPTQKELAKMNPYAFISLYKKGYKATLGGNGTKKYYVIQLTATNTKRSPSRITVHVSRSDYRLLYAKLTLSSGDTLTVSVTSYKDRQQWADSHFAFPSKSYPDVEVIDLR